MRTVLLRLSEAGLLEGMFLTGGTALSVFYLAHRTSEDLDLFFRDELDLAELAFRINRTGFVSPTTIKSARGFLRMVIDGVKLDMVHDPLSLPGERPLLKLEADADLAIDTIENVYSNKLAAAVSRAEAKDFVDLLFLAGAVPDIPPANLLEMARGKEALFDDPATAAYQLESNLESVLRGHAYPHMLLPLDPALMEACARAWARRLYERQK